MNEQLQVALADILSKTADTIDSGVVFLQAELPDVVRQLLTWKVVESVFYAFLLLIAAVVGAVFLKKSVHWLERSWTGEKLYYNNHHNEKEAEGKRLMDEFGRLGVISVPVSFFSTATIVLGVVLIPGYVATAIQIWVAPKIYLIEYAASLAK